MATDEQLRKRKRLELEMELAVAQEAEGVTPDPVTEIAPPSDDVDWQGIGEDWKRLPARTGGMIADTPQNFATLGEMGLDKASEAPVSESNFSLNPMDWLKQTPMGVTGRAILSNMMGNQQEIPAATETLPEGFKEEHMDRVVPQGQHPVHDALMFAGEVGLSGGRNLLPKIPHLLDPKTLAKRVADSRPAAYAGVAGGSGQYVGGHAGEQLGEGYEWLEPTLALTAALAGGARGAQVSARGTPAERAAAVINQNTDISPASYAGPYAPKPDPSKWASPTPFNMKGTGADIPPVPPTTPIGILAETASSPRGKVEGGTAGQIADDRAALGLEQYVQSQSPTANRLVLAAQQQRTSNTVRDTRAALGGADDVLPAQEKAKGLVQAVKEDIIKTRQAGETAQAGKVLPLSVEAEVAATTAKQADTAAVAAEEAALASRAQLTEDALLPGEASKQMHEVSTATRQGRKEAPGGADELWKTIDDNKGMPTGELKEAVGSKIIEMYPHLDYPSGKRFVNDIKDTIADLESLPASVPASEVQIIRSELSNLIEKFKAPGDAKRTAKTIANARTIKEEIDASISKVSAKHADAVAATKKLYDQFGDLKLETTLPETLLTPASIMGGKGAATARFIKQAESSDMDGAAEKYVLSQFKAKSGSAQKFLDDHADFLKEYPGIRTKIEAQAGTEVGATTARTTATTAAGTATEKQTGLTAAKAAQEQQRQRGRRQSRGRLGSLKKATIRQYSLKPDKTVDKLLSGEGSGRAFSDLNKRLTEAGKGDEFRGKVRDRVMAALHPSPTGTPTAKPAAIKKFNDIRHALVESKVISKKEADDITSALQRTRTDITAKEAISTRIDEASKKVSDLWLSAKASAGSQVVPSGHRLMMTGAIRRALKNQSWVPTPDLRVVDLIAEALSKPEALKKLAKLQDKEAINSFVSSVTAAAIAADKENE